MMDNIYKYKLFLKTVETGNITRTAEAFYVSQSAVSQQLKQLEEYFNQELFYKDKTLKLTPFGNTIKKEIEQLIKYYDHKENHIMSICKNTSDSLNISVKSSFFVDVLYRFFDKQHIKVNSIRNANNHEICHEVINGQAHFGFGEPEQSAENLEAVEIFQVPIILIANKNNPLVKKGRLQPSDLLEETMILYEDNTYIGTKIQDYLIKEQIYPKSVIRANHSRMIRSLIEVNYGMGFIYSYTFHSKQHPDLVRIELDNFDLKRPYYLLYNSKFLSTEHIKLKDTIVDYFKVNSIESFID